MKRLEDAMRQRLCGREQEFGFWLDSLGDVQSEIATEMIREILKIIPGMLFKAKEGNPMGPCGSHMPRRFSRGSVCYGDRLWFENGWKIYEDQQLLEVATAETFAGSLDSLAQEKATERVLSRAARRLRRRPAFRRLQLYKKNVSLRYPEPIRNFSDHQSPFDQPRFTEEDALSKDQKEGRDIDLADEVSYSSHQNYSYLLKREKRIFALLRNFLPAALPLTGSGHILRTGGKKKSCRYVFSQRAAHVGGIKSEGASIELTSRALINTRTDQFQGADERLGRLHVVARDGTRCEFQTWLVDAVTHLILRLAEEKGWTLPSRLRLRSPLATLRGLNQHPDLNYRILTVSGPKNIIGYNRIFLEAAKRLRPLSEMERKALKEWERVLDLLKAGAWKKLVGELDWATKRFLLETKMKEQRFDLDSLEAYHLEQEYHNISSDPKESWFARMDEAGLIRHLVSEKQIRQAMVRPPETRARTRGELVALCRRNSRLFKRLNLFDWDLAEITTETGLGCLYFGHPDNSFLPQSAPLEKLLKELKKSAD